jgi:hypothetical protein
MWKYTVQKWSGTIKDFFQLIYKIMRIITAPIWITRAAILKYNAFKARRLSRA